MKRGWELEESSTKKARNVEPETNNNANISNLSKEDWDFLISLLTRGILPVEVKSIADWAKYYLIL
jgi:hypothetical protein